MRVFVTGAAGYIGGSVAEGLLARGHAVTGLVRTADRAALMAERGITPVIGTLESDEILTNAALEADAVNRGLTFQLVLNLGKGQTVAQVVPPWLWWPVRQHLQSQGALFQRDLLANSRFDQAAGAILLRLRTQPSFKRAFYPRSGPASKRRRALSIRWRLSRTQAPSALTGTTISWPRSVSAYSTLGGLVGCTVRVIKPSRSRPRSVSASIFCEIPPMARRSPLKRLVSASNCMTIRNDHLSPIRANASVTRWQSSVSIR